MHHPNILSHTLSHIPSHHIITLHNTGTGWTFSFATADGLRDAAYHAVNTYRQYREDFDNIGKRGMQQDLSWDHAATLYEEVLVAAKYVW